MNKAFLFVLFGLCAGAAAGAFFAQRRSESRLEELQRRESAARETLVAELRETQEKLLAREKAWMQFNEDWNTALAARNKSETVQDKTPQSPAPRAAQDPHSFPARFNRALKEQGQSQWQLEECASVENGVVRGASFFRIGAHGAVSGMLRCKTMQLIFPPTPHALWLLCREGEQIEEGRKQALPDLGFRIELAPVKIEAIREALPELFLAGVGNATLSGDAISSGPTASQAPDLLRARLNALLEKDPGGYRFTKLGSGSPTELREVEIEEGPANAPIARFSAARAWPRFDQQGKTVELILEKGSVERKGQRSALPASGLRLHFSALTPASWKAAGGPSPR